MHISSIYGKILGEISRSKAKDIEKKKRERLNDGNNNGQLIIAKATSGGARKATWANIKGMLTYVLPYI